MMIDLRLGNALDILRTIPDKSVNCIITSPPYWGLRAYGTEPQIWQNGHALCVEHQWDEHVERTDETGYQRNRKGLNHAALVGDGNERKAEARVNNIVKKSDTCLVCGAWRGELGLEPTPELYVEHLTQILSEARRVLRDDGTLWLNLGDSYWGGKGKSGYELPDEAEMRKAKGETFQTAHNVPGYMDMRPSDGKHPVIKPKDLVGIPWRVAFALQTDGWYLRQDIIWAKPNPMPESVRDRCTKAHEYIFLLSKSQKYYFDADAIREPNAPNSVPTGSKINRGSRTRIAQGLEKRSASSILAPGTMTRDELIEKYYTNGRNRRSVWAVTTRPFKGAHFATFPPQLIEPMVLAGCPKDGTVLDPFNGAGTVGLVALKHGRNYIGIELKPDYLEMTRERIAQAQLTLPLCESSAQISK